VGGWRSDGCVPGVEWRTPGKVRGGLGIGHGVPERDSAVGWRSDKPDTVREGFGGRLRFPGQRCPFGPDKLADVFPCAGSLHLPASGPSGTRPSWTRPVSLRIGCLYGRSGGRKTCLMR
jgi:hypothetical protein